MYLPRLIPVLLLKNKGLVKTVEFKNEKYIGDPINAVKLFNDFETDELVFLDIYASRENRCISPDIIKNIAEEAFMPFSVGGGICNIKQVSELISNGAEKVVINSAIFNNFKLIEDVAKVFGSQSIIVSIDYRKSLFGNPVIYSNSGSVKQKYDIYQLVKDSENAGAGELLLNSISNDGKMMGYDLDPISSLSQIINIPLIACGGAGKYTHFNDAYVNGASAIAAGSIFVFQGPRRAVLINYPTKDERIKIFE